MKHLPIILKTISLQFPERCLFSQFSATIDYGDHIGIIGRNGSGKSTLLQIITRQIVPTEGSVHIPDTVQYGYVPQLQDQTDTVSGSQAFHKALTHALAKQPNVLLLDEPTNHLDQKNRSSLLRALEHFAGTLVIVSHDIELLRRCVTSIWHIDNGQITIFDGTYDDYQIALEQKQAAQQSDILLLTKEKRKVQKIRAFEQQRAARTKKMNKRENDRNLRELMKENASRTIGKHQKRINEQDQKIDAALHAIHVPKEIQPKFSLTAKELGSKVAIAIVDGTCGYEQPIIRAINLSVASGERVALLGDNASGKSTFFKALRDQDTVQRTGSWNVTRLEQIGYLDQHYCNLNEHKTVFDAIKDCIPYWSDIEIRKHLNVFLFSTQEQVTMRIDNLSGGEKVRLSLAQIAAKTPHLLLLDEVTNNIDQETREHLIQVLQQYPGTLLVISHDQDFLQAINIETYYVIADGVLREWYETDS